MRRKQQGSEGTETRAFAQLVRSSQDAAIAKDLKGVVTAWNTGAERLYAYLSVDIVGRSIELLYPPDVVEEERSRHARVAGGTSESGYRCRRVRADGSEVDVVMSLSPMRDDEGRVVGVGSMSRPVSESEHAEERFASLLEAAPDAIVCVDAAGCITFVNGQVSTLFGYERVELLGHQLELLLPEELREQHVGHRAGFARDPQVRSMGSGLSLQARRRDGSTFPVEISLAPDLEHADGLVIAAVRDVSDQRALEAEARETATRLRQLAESVDTVFVLRQLDPQAYLYVSPSSVRVLGWDPNEVADRATSIINAIHPDDVERVTRDYVIPSAAGLPATSEHRLLTADGSAKWVRTVATPVPDPSGRPKRMVITLEDISDRMRATEALREAEAAARAANEAKNLFLSRMSHELRTPLNAVLGFGQLLSRDLAGTQHAEAISHVVKGGRHLLDLINDVLDIARIESGEMPLSLEPVPVATLVEETLQLVGPLAEAVGVTLSATPGDDAALVLADRQRFRQILLNLLSNAIKYNQRGGVVVLGWECHGDWTRVTVTDSGMGITTELQSRLFTPFDRLGAERSGVEGTGIGLALTRAMVELMNGSISVTSVPGEGSCFMVSLPRAEPSQPPVDQVPTPPAAPMPREDQAVVLYIEDNEPNVRVMEHLLRSRPEWRLIHAGLGRLGLELARAHQPDLVLLDLHLPDVPGREVLVALKNNGSTAAIPVVIVTADANSDHPRDLLAAGAARCLTKPLDVDEVLAVLDAVGPSSPRALKA